MPEKPASLQRFDEPLENDSPRAHNQPAYSVSQVSQALKRSVEEQFGYVRVRGEVAGFKVHTSGHAYFKLKDDSAVLDGVCWRGVISKIPFKPEDGMEIVCAGKLTTYPARSNYQMVVEYMEPAGAGALMAMLEARRKKLQAEGLFDEARKKQLPYLPRVIGVVTSPTGAVIRDILHRISDRYPCRVIVWPVLVQGEGAAEQVANAIAGFNALKEGGPVPRPDLMIVARGGGSLEDLMAFNEEAVVRAAANSDIPLISAVGHETDTTLIDFASDRRAPTPTAAAEMAVPVLSELTVSLREGGFRLVQAIVRYLGHQAERIKGLARGLPSPIQTLEYSAQRLDDWAERLSSSLPQLLNLKRQSLQTLAASLSYAPLTLRMAHQADALFSLTERMARAAISAQEKRVERLNALSQMLASLNYENVLKRGFAMVKDNAGALITRAGDMTSGKPYALVMKDGTRKVVPQD